MDPQIDEDPFPLWQVTTLSLCLIAHSVSLTSLLPYVGFMVQDLGLARNIDEAGWYAGYITASFMIGRTLSSLCWGKFSDKYGRLPVLYFSLTAVGIFSFIFGFSVNVWMAVSVRFSLGICNGLVGAAKTMVSEVCSSKHESQGMGMVSGCWSLGLIIGPAIGGLLSRPVSQYPSLFVSDSIIKSILTRYPYLLPNLVPMMLCAIAIIMARRNLKETLVVVVAHHPETDNNGHIPVQQDDDGDDDEKEEDDGVELTQTNNSSSSSDQHTYTSLSSSSSGISSHAYHLLILFALTSGLDITYDTILPLWLISSAGLSSSSSSIGLLLVINGGVLVVYEIALFGRTNDAFGSKKLIVFAWIFAAPIIVCISLSNQLGEYSWYVITALNIVLSIPISTSFTSLNLLINHSVDKKNRGSINGMSQMAGSISRAIGPVVGSIMFAWSIDNSHLAVFDYHLSFLVMAGFSCIVACICFMLLK